MENEVVRENPLGTEPIGKLLRSFAVPSCVALVVNSLYNIVDQIFIGRGVGYLGNGATNTILPLTILVLALSLLFGDGCAAFYSMELGKKRPDEAAKGVGNALLFALGLGIILCIVCTVFLKPICRVTGVTDLILPLALDYGHIIIAGFPMVGITCAYACVIRADGSPKFSMAGLVSGCLVNIVLDYLFVFPMQMGVRGAALATIIGQAVNLIVFLFYFKRFRNVKLKKSDFKIRMEYVGKIARLGISSFIVQFSVVVIIVVVNNLLIHYGAMSEYGPEIPLTALGVTMKINNILISIMIGIGAGALPIIGYNYGAGNKERIKETVKLAIIAAMICGAIATFFFQVFPAQIISIFGAEDALYVQFAVKCLRIYLMLSVLDGMSNVAPTCFQAMNKPGMSAIASFMRQVGFNVPAQVLLCIVLGVNGVLWGGVVATAASFILVLLLLKKTWKRLDQEFK